MAFTVHDYHDMVRLLEQHPEWQAELRRLLLADDFLALPAIVRDLAEAQQRTEERLEQLAEAQQRTEERLEQLAEAQQRLEATVQALAEAQQRTEERLGQLAADIRALTGEVQRLADWQRGEARRREGERYERNIARSAPILFNGGQGGTPDESLVYQRMLEILNRLPNLFGLAQERNPMLADLIWWKDGQFVVVEVSLVANARDVARAARP